MANYIVLVKQVPDVTQITDNAFNPQTGTLLRNKLPSVINDLDTQALGFARHMQTISGDNSGKIVALTMGPPQAEEVIRYCLYRNADLGILLTDRALGGADTWATANPLSYAIRKIVRDIFGGSNEYYIVSGMQSVDGDTAQVPAQIAEELKLPCIAYATEVEYKNDRFEITRIVSGGSQTVAAKSLPCVVTVAKYEYPLFASFAATRAAKKTSLIQWGVNDITPTGFGVDGSKTRVTRVFPPGKTSRKCVQLHSPEELAHAILDSFKSDASVSSASQSADYILPNQRHSLIDRHFEATQKDNEDFKALAAALENLQIKDGAAVDAAAHEKILAALQGHINAKALDEMLAGLAAAGPAYRGDVWVVAEHSEGVLHSAAAELTGKARHLADSLKVKVGVVLVGHKVESLASELFAAGADDVYLVDHPLLAEFDPTAYRKAFTEVIGKYWPQIVLFAATPQGRVLAPMVSYRLDCGLTADCTGLEIRDNSRKNQIAMLLQTRPALGGNVMATIATMNSRSQMATARPGVFKRPEPDSSRKGNIIRHSITITADDISLDIIKTELAHGTVNLAHAKAIVSGGRGMKNRDAWESLLALLAGTLTKKLGVDVERGASRGAVEQGFTERIRQVGQTGTSVGPKLYVACGISGAIQHMIGVANAETIIAVNADPHAPIFKLCDYYLIGTVESVVPKLVQSLEAI